MFSLASLGRTLRAPVPATRSLCISPVAFAVGALPKKPTSKPVKRQAALPTKKSVKGTPKAKKFVIKKEDMPPPVAISPWTLYVKEHSVPGARATDGIKQLAAEFKNLSPEERQTLNDRTAVIAVERVVARQEWLKNVDPAIVRHLNKRKNKGTIKLPRREDYIKQPLSGFFRYIVEQRQAGVGSELKMTEQTKLVAEKWRALSDDERKPYIDAYEAERVEYRVKIAEQKANDAAAAA